MGFRISHIHEYDRFIAIDLGSYRVRAVLYRISDGRLCIEWSASVRQHKKNMDGWNIADMQGVAETIDSAIHEACKNSTEIPDDIIVGFSPTISVHDSMTSQYMREDESAPLTMEELDMMIEKIEKASLMRAKEKAKFEYGIVHDDIRLISSTLTSILIDGKKVSHAIWLPGKYVRIQVLNVFTLASEYNVLRSIISSLKKRTISLVPIALLFPKIIEKSNISEEESIFIDIGYTHVNFVFQKERALTFFETFPMGSHMLMQGMKDIDTNGTHTTIENLLMRKNPTTEESLLREQWAREYFTYIIDTLLSILIDAGETLKMKNIILSGWIFGAPWMEKLFLGILSESLGYTVRHILLEETQKEDILPASYTLSRWLALLWQELLHTKKDPIIRILRYTLYHYE